MGVISYGLSSYGYDARVADEFKIFTNVDSAVVDPRIFAPRVSSPATTPVCIIPPNSFALAHTVEYFRIPRDILVICLGKSTYARCGIIVNVTPLEPEWEGQVTIEISNTTPASGPHLRPGRHLPILVSARCRPLRDQLRPTKPASTCTSAASRSLGCEVFRGRAADSNEQKFFASFFQKRRFFLV